MSFQIFSSFSLQIYLLFFLSIITSGKYIIHSYMFVHLYIYMHAYADTYTDAWMQTSNYGYIYGYNWFIVFYYLIFMRVKSYRWHFDHFFLEWSSICIHIRNYLYFSEMDCTWLNYELHRQIHYHNQTCLCSVFPQTLT